jgi:hypothetical protein
LTRRHLVWLSLWYDDLRPHTSPPPHPPNIRKSLPATLFKHVAIHVFSRTEREYPQTKKEKLKFNKKNWHNFWLKLCAAHRKENGITKSQ